MPAVSKSQQRFFGLLNAVKKGDVPKSKVSKKMKETAKEMTKKEIRKFAKTKHKGLPEKVKKSKKIKKSVKENTTPETKFKLLSECISK